MPDHGKSQRAKLFPKEGKARMLRVAQVIDSGARSRGRTGTAVTSRGILSPLRLPISPPGRKKMEAEVGIEPASTDLQSAA